VSQPPSRRRPAPRLRADSAAIAGGPRLYDCPGGCLSSPAKSAAGNCAA
jgi:hypothetical protein